GLEIESVRRQAGAKWFAGDDGPAQQLGFENDKQCRAANDERGWRKRIALRSQRSRCDVWQDRRSYFAQPQRAREIHQDQIRRRRRSRAREVRLSRKAKRSLQSGNAGRREVDRRVARAVE